MRSLGDALKAAGVSGVPGDDDPRAAPRESATSKLHKMCKQMAEGTAVDPGEFNHATDAAFEEGSCRRYPESKALDERLDGWARAAMGDRKPRQYLRRLVVFKQHLNNKTLSEFLAQHLARRLVLGLPRDPLHALASSRADKDPEFEHQVAMAIRAFRAEKQLPEPIRVFREEKQRPQLNPARAAARAALLEQNRAKTKAEVTLRRKLTLPAIPRRLISPAPIESDFALCAAWHNVRSPEQVRNWDSLISVVGSPTNAVRLLTARLGERAALGWYREMGHSVVDVSLTQLDPASRGEWMSHDLLVDGIKKVDVKTARQSFIAGFDSPNYYSGFLVQKRDDNALWRDVALLGVLTPYVSLRDFDPGSGVATMMLGEVKRGALEDLSSWLSEQDRGFRFVAPSLQRKLPGWYFSSEDLQQRLATYIAGAADAYREATASDVRIDLPDKAIRLLQSGSETDHSLILGVVEKVGRGPFATVLVMLVSFAEWVARGTQGRWDESIADLSIDHRVFHGRHLLSDDPGGYVATFRRALHQIASRAATIGLSRLRDFRLHGPGLLSAHDRETDRRVTLLAYCGEYGCGYAPLVLGTHRNCETCGKLICPREAVPGRCCGFCSEDCPGMRARRNGDGDEVVASSPFDQQESVPTDPAYDRYSASWDDD